ncbi:hypothetical protein AX15_006711 [Amanita polypyramis BW_CC]|nr:hypothetical protein AX15_006711 [Amanita polypyramis BW_CC]
MTTENTGFFNRAQGTIISQSNITDVHYTVNNMGSAAVDQIAPLPPSKQSSGIFTGRDLYLKDLQDYFAPHSVIQRKSCLLYGMGGIGKTQICLKFIEQSEHL